ncbi:saccharopine dehydrogenase NADP-binding domain-containing protein [Halogeometricum sp. S1BR25-6]|uniref:Saccharopine dehydrogenase NADP-binding domain-containing protein n=1 Tax=Halogeometricum salsisoli TaxID=2950536 RepID=A0ABU2GIR3_9EURY|nr:saccharopine dehydrogenase NADP-binding domain-containing protein [Halogeometricum sp. S1BR25-6]MDS0300169.1 saccharopine dehydrogenase NADP-binding domain-containing protein [Halogeometricum sp. S1BR25-6]
MTENLLLYGAYGYAGSLIVETAVERGFEPILAGRRAEPLETQATELGLDHRTFSLTHPNVVENQVADADAVLNCAGPFSSTARPLLNACLETGTDYLDIAGRYDVLEETAQRDEEAADAGITLLPAVGFDVVPTNCLTSYLAERVEDPTHLRVAIDGLGTFSPGTVKAILEQAGEPGTVREDGRLRSVPLAWKSREFTFEGETKSAVTVPWGEVSTAYHATGIPNVETYATVPEYAQTAMKRARGFAPVFGWDPLQSALQAAVDAVVEGPTAAERAQSINRIAAEVEGADGDTASAGLRTPDTYDLTAQTAVDAAGRVLDGDVDAGFHTPSAAFGADYVLEFSGVERDDTEELA